MRSLKSFLLSRFSWFSVDGLWGVVLCDFAVVHESDFVNECNGFLLVVRDE